MAIKFNVPGSKRKELANELSAWLGYELNYKGAPTFAYEIGETTIDKNGNVEFGTLSEETIERLLQHIYDEGFEFETVTEESSEATTVEIQVPFENVKVGSLTSLLETKGSLIKKALGINDIRVKMYEDKVGFPWFDNQSNAETLKAYTTFITKLCEMTMNQKRINKTESTVNSEKYAFRCFLLRLGFVGDEFKADRKILLQNLSGSSAFKSEVKSNG